MYLLPRFHIFEIHDLERCPDFFRHLVTSGLSRFWTIMNYYRKPIRFLLDMLKIAKTDTIIDLCSGSGGPLPLIQRDLKRNGIQIRVKLTDLVPDVSAYRHIVKEHLHLIEYVSEPVDATSCSLVGFRTIFGAFHHFPPKMAELVLKNAIDSASTIAIFEVTERTLYNVFVFYPLVIPFITLLYTPFIRPFSLVRLLLTYIIPVLPFVYTFDGLVSCLRTYTPEEMRIMTDSIPGSENYIWIFGRQSFFLSPNLVYYLGYPKPQ
jgi:hypothetical protein